MVAARALVFLAVALWIGLARAEPQSAPSTMESPATSSPAAPSSAAPGWAAPNSPAPNSPAPNPVAASPPSANPAAPNTTSPSATSPSATAPGAIPPSGQPVVPHPPTADDICRAVERDAAENEIPVEFFARVIWQESRFQSGAIGPLTRRGERAQGIAQFMPGTASERRLLDPFDPVQADRKSVV